MIGLSIILLYISGMVVSRPGPYAREECQLWEGKTDVRAYEEELTKLN
jgi:hypothetical protein